MGELYDNYIPMANRAGGYYQAVPSAEIPRIRFMTRFDYRINKDQNFSVITTSPTTIISQPFNNFQAGGATVPGFGGLVDSRYQQINLSHTWTSAIRCEPRVLHLHA